MNFLHQSFQKLSSERQTDRQTDTTEIIYHAPPRVVSEFQEVQEVTITTTRVSFLALFQESNGKNDAAPLKQPERYSKPHTTVKTFTK